MGLLCEPYLLDPRPDGVHVVWHTATPGTRHVVVVGPAVPDMADRETWSAATGKARSGPGWQRFVAQTVALSRTREDSTAGPRRRPVHRHLAAVSGLPTGRTPYRVVSIDGAVTVSAPYALSPAVPAGQPVTLLLTSDHQLRPMTAANLAKVAETVGEGLDGVLMAGDMVNVPDRASDWFDSAAGSAFFACLTGRADVTLAGRSYRGAPILQHTPLYPAIGNHEVMGRWSATAPLDSQFNDPQPDDWDVTTYRQLFPVPRSSLGGPRWWSRTIGDVRLITLFVTRIWRPFDAGDATFGEAAKDVADPRRWGHGQFIFEPVARGSAQYSWLERELWSPQARRARYRVVMFHHPSHGLGHHSVPAFTDPIRRVEGEPATAVTYRYPLEDDQILRDVEPLLSAAGVHLVLTGHSHVWNRFRNAAGVNWLETSNVGNSYGAYDETSARSRAVPPGNVRQGDPGGLVPITPTVAPLTGPAGGSLPYLASDHITAFSILDSTAGLVRSYRFDVREPDPPVVLFDEFPLD